MVPPLEAHGAGRHDQATEVTNGQVYNRVHREGVVVVQQLQF